MSAKKRSLTPLRQFIPVIIGCVLVMLGVVGVIIAINLQKEEVAQTTDGTIPVIEANGNYPQQDGKAGQALQGAASVKDFQGKENDLQQSSSIDELLKEKEIR